MSDDSTTAKDEQRRLHKRDLPNSNAPLALGLLVARQLLEYGQSTVYLDDEGYVAICAPGEAGLDSLPEEMAINTLVSQEWDEGEISLYLRGRDARLNANR